jgi:hypothetical protein
MNTYAHKTTIAVYANTAAEKRNSCADRNQRLYKNFKPVRYPERNKFFPDSHNSRCAVDSIITFFNGTLVTEHTAAVEWGRFDCISLNVNV